MATRAEMVAQHSQAWLDAATPEAIAVARSQGSLDVFLGRRELEPGEQFQDPAPVVQRDAAWVLAHKGDANETVRALGAGELRDYLAGQ